MADDLFAEARTNMVDSQIRPNKVNDPRILGIMRRLKRERFLPAALSARAYSDEDVPLGGGRYLMEPMVLARLIQTAGVMDGERALVVGAGVGYGAAVLATCGARVTALEEDPELVALAGQALADAAPAVNLVSGKLAVGWPSGAPYDIILIEGAVHEIPRSLASQLRNEGGRLVGVLCGRGRTNQAVLAEVTDAGLRAQPVFDCATPPLPMFIPAPAFQF
jgi:protein-L-isoaspartate(D-aspartate) O-methyltransferase